MARDHSQGWSPKPIYRRISSGSTRAAANGCNQLKIPKGIRLPLPSFLKLDKFLQRRYLSKVEIPLRNIGWEGGMKTSTHPPMRSYEGDQMQDCEQSKAEANVISPRRHDYGDRKKRRK